MVSGFQSLVFFIQAEDGIRDSSVTGVQTCALLIQAEDGIRDSSVTGVQTCALPIWIVLIPRTNTRTCFGKRWMRARSLRARSKQISQVRITFAVMSSRNRMPRPALLIRSEEHTSELQSHLNLVCRLLLEKKKDDSRVELYTV